MAKTNWIKSLSEVLKQPTEKVTLISKKTGNEYVTDIVKQLMVVSIGIVEEVKGGYKYSIIDTKNQLEYIIKAPTRLDISIGTVLVFTNVRGGVTGNGDSWYSAGSVTVARRNE